MKFSSAEVWAYSGYVVLLWVNWIDRQLFLLLKKKNCGIIVYLLVYYVFQLKKYQIYREYRKLQILDSEVQFFKW